MDIYDGKMVATFRLRSISKISDIHIAPRIIVDNRNAGLNVSKSGDACYVQIDENNNISIGYFNIAHLFEVNIMVGVRP